MRRFPVRRLQVRRSQAGALAGLTLLLAPLPPVPALRAETLPGAAGTAGTAHLQSKPAELQGPGTQAAGIQAQATPVMATRQARNPGVEALGGTPLLAEATVPGTAGNPGQGLGEALAPSSSEQMALGSHLRQKGFLFYGAWWCPACFRQKSLFGEQAGNRLPYVECDRTDAGRERCQAAMIQAYPTWVRGQERREGMLSLEELARWSGWKPR